MVRFSADEATFRADFLFSGNIPEHLLSAVSQNGIYGLRSIIFFKTLLFRLQILRQVFRLGGVEGGIAF